LAPLQHITIIVTTTSIAFSVYENILWMTASNPWKYNLSKSQKFILGVSIFCTVYPCTISETNQSINLINHLFSHHILYWSSTYKLPQRDI